jgi:hypothetical protein
MPNYCFGKLEPRISYKTPLFSAYATAELPAPPASFSILPRVYQAFGITNPAMRNSPIFLMDDNDTVGDCTIAGVAHIITIWCAMVGVKGIMSPKACLQLYYALTGGQDTGLVELSVLDYWSLHPIYGTKIKGHVSVKPSNMTHVKQALTLSPGLYLGMQCQENAVQDFDAGKPWTPGALTEDGHCIAMTGYDDGKQEVELLTWGGVQYATYDWLSECVDEIHCLLPPEAKNPAFMPGFDYAQLQADLKKIGTSEK